MNDVRYEHVIGAGSNKLIKVLSQESLLNPMGWRRVGWVGSSHAVGRIAKPVVAAIRDLVPSMLVVAIRVKERQL